ncbi:hypothetical protein C8J56DRAFT_833360 [Mycena floridula]|nr:hypothetical protein C8J56DRAFT_833360 [Mycena floridula]
MSSTKRKSTTQTGARSKKARQEPDHSAAKDLVQTVLDDETELNASDATALARYARYLEEELENYKPKIKSSDQLAAEAQTMRNVCVSGIKKQMVWKTTCKTGGAKFSYEGVCADPNVLGAMFKVDGAPKKMQKFTVEEFEDIMGSIDASTRYDSLELVGNVNVSFKPDVGTFKINGSYGAPRHMNKNK